MDLFGSLAQWVTQMETGESPLIIVHGTLDEVVPFQDAEALVAQAELVGIPYEFYPIEGAGHWVDIFTVEAAPGETLFDRIVQFFFVHLDLPYIIPVFLSYFTVQPELSTITIEWSVMSTSNPRRISPARSKGQYRMGGELSNRWRWSLLRQG